MSGAIPPLPQYAFMAWCLVKAQGQFHFFLHDPKQRYDSHFTGHDNAATSHDSSANITTVGET
jgi:hypothetical protein